MLTNPSKSLVLMGLDEEVVPSRDLITMVTPLMSNNQHTCCMSPTSVPVVSTISSQTGCYRFTKHYTSYTSHVIQLVYHLMLLLPLCLACVMALAAALLITWTTYSGQLAWLAIVMALAVASPSTCVDHVISWSCDPSHFFRTTHFMPFWSSNS